MSDKTETPKPARTYIGKKATLTNGNTVAVGVHEDGAALEFVNNKGSEPVTTSIRLSIEALITMAHIIAELRFSDEIVVSFAKDDAAYA